MKKRREREKIRQKGEETAKQFPSLWVQNWFAGRGGRGGGIIWFTCIMYTPAGSSSPSRFGLVIDNHTGRCPHLPWESLSPWCCSKYRCWCVRADLLFPFKNLATLYHNRFQYPEKISTALSLTGGGRWATRSRSTGWARDTSSSTMAAWHR